MSRRAATTILLITRTGLVRADLTRSPKPTLIDFWSQARPELPDLVSLVEAGFLMGPKPGKNVWVLCSDLWTQTLPLPAQHAAQLVGHELAQALNFEAEALSGLSALDAVLAFVPQESQDGEQQFWITQGARTDLEAVDDVTRKAGSKLAGLCHPGGLPGPVHLEAAATESWQRIELWPDAVLCLQGKADGEVQVHVVNSDPPLGRWKNSVDTWRVARPPVKHIEILVAAGIDPPADADAQRVFRMDNQAALGRWLVSWAEHAAVKSVRMPVLHPAAKPLTTAQRRRIALVLALGAMALCAGHNQWLDYQSKQIASELKVVQAPSVQLPGVEKQVKDVEANRDTLKAQGAKLRRQAERVNLQRERLARLLEFLARHKAEDLLIQRIDSEGGEPKVVGLCLQPELADQFARVLAEKMRPLGWEVQTPRKKMDALMFGGGPWSFEIAFHSTADDKALDPRAAKKTR